MWPFVAIPLAIHSVSLSFIFHFRVDLFIICVYYLLPMYLIFHPFGTSPGAAEGGGGIAPWTNIYLPLEIPETYCSHCSRSRPPPQLASPARTCSVVCLYAVVVMVI